MTDKNESPCDSKAYTCFRWGTLSLIVEMKMIAGGTSCKIHFMLATTKVRKVHVVLALLQFSETCVWKQKSPGDQPILHLINISRPLVATPPSQVCVPLSSTVSFQMLEKGTMKYQFYMQKSAGRCERELNMLWSVYDKHHHSCVYEWLKT